MMIDDTKRRRWSYDSSSIPVWNAGSNFYVFYFSFSPRRLRASVQIRRRLARRRLARRLAHRLQLCRRRPSRHGRTPSSRQRRVRLRAHRGSGRCGRRLLMSCGVHRLPISSTTSSPICPPRGRCIAWLLLADLVGESPVLHQNLIGVRIPGHPSPLSLIRTISLLESAK